MASLYQGFKLHIAQDAYLVQPTGSTAAVRGGSSGKAPSLHIDRRSNKLTLSPDSALPTKADKTLDIHGILGIITLSTSDYLVVITARKQVATLLGAQIYIATDFRVLPLAADLKRSSLQANASEKALLALLKTHLYSAPFYFSYDYDLTSCFQRQARNASALGSSAAMWRRADDRFFWNRHLQSRLIDFATQSSSREEKDISPFILPCLYGFLEIKKAAINGRSFTFGLIARRSRFRAGTRYFSRGIDKEGHVSNFNETEQFVLLDPASSSSTSASEGSGAIRMSYVQTRGSVPVYWAEVNNLRYKPDLLVMEKDETLPSAQLHFHEQNDLYGDVFLVNLVNQSGYEQPVKEAYERLVSKLNNPRVHYQYYDFHHECKGMKFERVLGLVELMNQKGLANDNYFVQDASGSTPRVTKQQNGVLRTNCMDCLDRTNVVQSTFGRAVLGEQLRAAGVLKQGEGIDQHKEFWHTFRNVWADHADVISKAYSGTGALKTDFTRTGKRSKEGALQDGVNSLTRYLKNNFFDGARQDAYDLFTGAWNPRAGDLKIDERALLVRSMPWILLFSAIMIFAAIFLPRDSTRSMFYFSTFWSVVAAFAFQYIVARGLFYVDWPRLNKPNEAIFYEGPGFYSGRKGRLGITGKYGKNMKKTSRLPVTEKASEAPSARKGRRGYTQEE